MPKLDELKKLVQKTNLEVASDACKEWNMQLDSANFQTKSKKDFEKYMQDFGEEGLELLMTLSHSARKIAVLKVSDAQKQKFFGLNYVELSEPKPGKKIEKTEWEYVSYIVPDYEDFIQKGCPTADDLNKVREIGKSKFCYYYPLQNKIQFRNMSIAQAEEATDGSSGDIEDREGVEDTGTATPTDNEISKDKEEKLRIMADFENYRKSTEARVQQIYEQAGRNLVSQLLEIIDDLERAIGQLNDKDGLQGVLSKLLNLIQQEGYVLIQANPGDDFNHNEMEALSATKAESPETANKVQEVITKGYKHAQSGDVLRMARVVVSKYQA